MTPTRQCSKAHYDHDAMVLKVPLIVAEATRPSMRDDAEEKLAEYFSVPAFNAA
ncbi:MAG TPA: hypothetical protein VFZ16_20635 [Hyphomicrobiaceae bacterium]|nr:hypothetical protein [Hyphomicrobiaceae bacterium]